MPVIRENPQWWIVEIFDGFGAHQNNLLANTLRMESLILSLKEEGDSSSINQAYDKYVAKEDKRIQRINMMYLKELCKTNSRITGQWDLLHCGLAAMRHSGRNPDLWENSFRACNIQPSSQIPFREWCKKIEPFLVSGDSFDLVTQDDHAIGEYMLLTMVWYSMSTAKKTVAVSIVKQHGLNAWSVDCCQELASTLDVTLTELMSL